MKIYMEWDWPFCPVDEHGDLIPNRQVVTFGPYSLDDKTETAHSWHAPLMRWEMILVWGNVLLIATFAVYVAFQVVKQW